MTIDTIQAETIIKSVLKIYEAQEEELKQGLPDIKDIETDLFNKNEDEIISSIEKTIILLNEFYYKHDKPLVEDDIYDTLREDFLEELDPENQLLQKVGEDIEEKNDFFQKSQHEIIAGSQSKVKYSEREKFQEKIEDFNSAITISDKMDGITLVITYTNDKEKAYEHIDEIFEYHLSYIENSNKSAKEKKEIREYILSQKQKITEFIKEVKEEDYFPYKIVTRGDGIIGEDITLNAFDVQGLVKTIKKEKITNEENIELIIRGEALIMLDDFEGLPYKNPRNGVATIRKQNGRHRDKITFIPFEKIKHNIKTEELEYPNRAEMFKWFNEQGFKTPYYETFTNVDEMEEAIEKRLKDRANDKINYWIDGLILSIDDVEEREKLGMVGKKPKGEFAFKPDPERAIGQIEEIEFTVGKTGNITPVAKFKEPVPISGSDIEFVSLANEDIMKEIAPAKGTLVEVVKRGEIIPKIEKNINLEPINSKIEEFIISKFIEGNLATVKLTKEINKKLQDGKLHKIFNKNIDKDFKTSFVNFVKELIGDEEYIKLVEKKNLENIINIFIEENKDFGDKIIKENLDNKIEYPKSCPSCGTELEKGKVLVKCTSKNCRGKHIAQLTFFAQKLTKEIGEGKIKQLYDKGLLKTYADFFKITKNNFKDENGEYFEGWQESSINKFLKAVEGIKESKDNEFFSSLFFENIGEDKFLKLFQKVSFEEMKPELEKIEKKIPEEFNEISTTEKFISELEKINYPNIEIIKKIAEVEGWGAIGIVRLINLWVEEREDLDELLSIIKLIPTEKVEVLEEELSVVITGSVDKIPEYMEEAKGKSNRDKLKNYLKSKGHKCPGSVSKNTTCLVSDTVSTTGKFAKALELNIPILTSDKFIEQYGEMLSGEQSITKQNKEEKKKTNTP
jgi:NAD-dependent DNA ligase